MTQNCRRPVLILAIGSWLISGFFLTKSTIWLCPLLIVLTFRDKRTWLILLMVFRLLLITQAQDQVYQGLCQVFPVDYTRIDQWRVTIDNTDYLFQGQLPGSGRYRVDAKLIPFRTNRYHSGFSEHDYYRSLGFHARAEFDRFDLVTPLEEGWSFHLQQSLYRQLDGYGDSQNLAYALLFGGSRLLDRSFHRSLREIGLLHLLVVSGLHLRIYDRSIDRILKRFMVPRLIRRGLILGTMYGLLIITDFHPSCVRSIGLILLQEGVFYRKTTIDRLDQLALISWLMLLINPYWATGTGFLLGTIAHASLVLPRRPSILRLYLVILPFQLLLNGILSPFYVLANLGLACLMSQVLPLLALTVIVPVFQNIGQWWLLGLIKILHQLHQLDLLKLEVMMPSPWVIGLILIFYILLLLRLESEIATRWFQQYRIGIFILLGVVIGIAQTAHIDHQVGVHFLDVGQGDAAVIITQTGRSILIDTSRSDRFFDHLRYLGIGHFDAVFISHRDDDHSKWVDQLSYHSGYTSRYTPLPGFQLLEAGDRLSFDEVEMMIYHPDRNYDNENDNSLVIQVYAHGKTFLFGGDVSGDMLQASWIEDIDIFKYPHHGSLHSLNPNLTNQTDIGLIVLSYGKNKYQHPHPVVIDYFNQTKLHETYHQGSIHLYNGRFRCY